MKPKRITNARELNFDVTFETPRTGFASCYCLRNRGNQLLAEVFNHNGANRRAEFLSESPSAVLDLVEVLRYARKQFEEFKHGHGSGRFHAWNMIDDAIAAYAPLEQAISADIKD